TDRDELRHPADRLLLEDRDGVAPADRLPLGVARARRLGTSRLAPRPPLGPREVGHRPGGRSRPPRRPGKAPRGPLWSGSPGAPWSRPLEPLAARRPPGSPPRPRSMKAMPTAMAAPASGPTT